MEEEFDSPTVYQILGNFIGCNIIINTYIY